MLASPLVTGYVHCQIGKAHHGSISATDILAGCVQSYRAAGARRFDVDTGSHEIEEPAYPVGRHRWSSPHEGGSRHAVRVFGHHLGKVI